MSFENWKSRNGKRRYGGAAAILWWWNILEKRRMHLQDIKYTCCSCSPLDVFTHKLTNAPIWHQISSYRFGFMALRRRFYGCHIKSFLFKRSHDYRGAAWMGTNFFVVSRFVEKGVISIRQTSLKVILELNKWNEKKRNNIFPAIYHLTCIKRFGVRTNRKIAIESNSSFWRPDLWGPIILLVARYVCVYALAINHHQLLIICFFFFRLFTFLKFC